MAEVPAAPSSLTLTLGELASLVGGRLYGDGKFEIRGVSPLATAVPDQIALLVAARYRADVPASHAGALLVAAELEKGLDDTRPRVVVGDPHAALIPLLALFHPEPPARAGVHPTAVLERGLRLGAEVEVGPYAVLGEGTEVGDRVRVGAHDRVPTRNWRADLSAVNAQYLRRAKYDLVAVCLHVPGAPIPPHGPGQSYQASAKPGASHPNPPGFPQTPSTKHHARGATARYPVHRQGA